MTEQIYPHPTIGALIFDPKGNLFLMKSHKWHGKYVVPGGHIELGETMEDALRREVKEETNLEIFDIEFLIFQEFIYDDAFWKEMHFIFFDFVCKSRSTNNVILNNEASEYTWVAPEKALEMSIDEYTHRAVQEFIKKKKDLRR